MTTTFDTLRWAIGNTEARDLCRHAPTDARHGRRATSHAGGESV